MKKIAIHSVPRSGSTWLGTIFDSSPEVLYRFQPLFSYALKGQLSPSSSKEDVDSFFDTLLKIEDDFLEQKDAKERGVVPKFQKQKISALVYKEVRYNNILDNLLTVDSDLKVVGLIRNPLAVLNSWLKAPKEFRPDLGWKVEDEWRFAPSKNQGKPEEFNGYEKWKEVAKMFHEFKLKYPTQFLLVTYSDLISNPIREVEKIFEFCGVSVSPETQNFIIESTSLNKEDAYGVYRTIKADDKWKKELDPKVIEFVSEDLKETDLAQYLAI